jgi:hypothetical protein
MADWPWSSASADLQLGIPLYRLLENVTVKPTHVRMQGGPTPRAHWAVAFAHCLLVLGTPPGVTLVLVEFQIFL